MAIFITGLVYAWPWHSRWLPRKSGSIQSKLSLSALRDDQDASICFYTCWFIAGFMRRPDRLRI